MELEDAAASQPADLAQAAEETAVLQTGFLALLKSKDFFFLWIGQSVSSFGDKFTEIAIPIMIYNLTGSALQLGLAFGVRLTANSIMGIVAGALSDRWNRRLTMIYADLARALLIFLLTLVPWLPVALPYKLGVLYTVLFVTGALRQLYVPAKVACIPQIVKPDQLMLANSLDQATMMIMEFVGYGTAGLLSHFIGTGAAFGVDGLSFVFSAICIAQIALPAMKPTAGEQPKSSFVEDIAYGFRYVCKNAMLLRTLWLSLTAPIALGVVSTLVIVYSRRVFQAGDAGYGLIEALNALGLSVGLLILVNRLRDMRRDLFLTVGVIGMGIAWLLAFGIPPLLQLVSSTPALWLAVAAPFLFFGGMANGAIFIGIRTIIQENADSHIIGRAFSVISVASTSAMLVGALFAGLADLVRVEFIVVSASLILLLIGIVFYLSSAFRKAPNPG
ncbi:MAG: MFS transporter [Chloroflexota bacterium]